MAPETTSLAQRSQTNLHFDHKDMVYYLGWIMGREIYGGSRADECLAVAARIPDGGPVAWHREWQRLAESVESEARAAASADDPERAGAPTCVPAPTFARRFFVMSSQDPTLRPLVRQMQACFQAAAALFKPPIEAVTVPFAAKTLPGSFWRVATTS